MEHPAAAVEVSLPLCIGFGASIPTAVIIERHTVKGECFLDTLADSSLATVIDVQNGHHVQSIEEKCARIIAICSFHAVIDKLDNTNATIRMFLL